VIRIKRNIKNILLCASICALLFASLASLVRASRKGVGYDFSEGEISTVDIFAPRDIVDRYTTENLKNQAAAKVSDKYKIDLRIKTNALNNLADFFALIFNTKNGQAQSDLEGAVSSFSSLSRVKLSEDEILYLLTMSDEEFLHFQKNISDILDSTLSEGVLNKDEALLDVKEKLQNSNIGDIGLKIISAFLVENKFFDEEGTQRERQKAKDDVAAVVYKKNQSIVRKGEIITPAHIAMLEDLGLLKSANSIDKFEVFGVFSLLIVLFGASVLYILIFNKNLFSKPDMVLLIAVSVLISMVLCFYMDKLNLKISALPVALSPILVALLIDRNLGLFLSIPVSIVAVFMLNENWLYAICFIIICTFSIYILKFAKTRVGLVTVSILSSVISALVFFAFYMHEVSDMGELLSISLHSLIGSLFMMIVIIGILPFFELFFDVITPFKLMELTNPDRKLLKRLLLEAPGTYHHSLTVANMAEAAAEEIGANYLLARVGAYYHDIGKLKAPQYFKENQNGDNPHDYLNPKDSAQIIISHVNEGVELSQKHRLPKMVEKIIREHHGVLVMEYFYKKVENIDGVNKEDFTYKGPKPSFKESAVVSLADSIEAAVRSLDRKSLDTVREMIDKIVTSRLLSGHLDNSNLTLSEIEIIKKSFLNTLSGYYHERIEYPN